jgi:RNA polymerase sigma-70 factor (ECF subfamily)
MQDSCVTAEAARSLEDEVAALHHEHAAALLRYAWGTIGNEETAREGVQETFLRYFIERSYGREILHPKGWLFEVLRNYLYDRASTLAAQREISFDHAESRPDLNPGPEVLVGGMQAAQRIAESLSERELECLRLRTEGLSYGEIGVAMQVRTGTVGALLARAHEKIRRLADADGSGSMVAAAVFQLIEERSVCTQS